MSGRTHRFMGLRVGAGLAAGALVGSLLGVAAAAPASAATTTVNCPSGNLQNAINAAAAGTNVYVTGTCTGTFTIGKNLTLIGPAILDGGGSGPVVNVPSGVIAKLSALTVQNGNTVLGGTGLGNVGGGGVSNAGNLTLSNTTVTNNQSSVAVTGSSTTAPGCSSNCSAVSSEQLIGLAGAGIGNTGTLSLTSSTVKDNTASGTGDLTQTVSPSCTDNCTVAATHLLIGNAGGGILNLGGTVNLTSSTVSGNTATGSGALHMNQSASCNSNCSVRIDGLELGDAGGGILNHAGTLNVNSSTVSGNTTSATDSLSITQGVACTGSPNCSVSATAVALIGGGGGIYNDATLNVTSSNVLSNSSNTQGGGVFNSFNFTGQPAVATVKSSNISNNSTTGAGGGVFNLSTLTLKSNSITSNSAASGGGVYNGGSLTQSSNTFSANTPDNCVGC